MATSLCDEREKLSYDVCNKDFPGIKYTINMNFFFRFFSATLMAESKEELKSLLMKEESEKPGLKLNIQKTKMLA